MKEGQRDIQRKRERKKLHKDICRGIEKHSFAKKQLSVREEERIDKKKQKKQENVLQMLYLDFVINGVFLLWGPKIQFVKSGVRYKRGSL